MLDPDRLVCRWPSLDTRDWLASFLERAEVDANVVAVIAIGSAIRPDVTSDDLDVMVVCRDVVRLREKAPIEIDLRKANVDSVDEQISAGHDLLVWAVRFGRPLLDRDGTWAEIARRWTSRLPLPDPTVALARAEAARRRMEKMRVIGDDDAVAELQVSHLTHRARATLAMAGVQPASRPELSGQLRDLGEVELADDLERALSKRVQGASAERPAVAFWRPAAVGGPVARRERANGRALPGGFV